MIVTHDRYFLDNVTGWMLELDRGNGIPYEGNYSAWLEQKAKRVAQEESESEARQRALARELEWVAPAPRARQAKSKARLAAYDELVENRRAKRRRRPPDRHPARPRLGQVVIEVEGWKGVRRQAAVQGPHRSSCRPAASSA